MSAFLDLLAFAAWWTAASILTATAWAAYRTWGKRRTAR